MSSNLSDAETHDLLLTRYFKTATMLAECKDVLLIHHHFILVVIEFKLKETRLFDSLKGRQSAVTAHVSRYCEDLERFFNLSDSPVYTHENMSDQITQITCQGNSYDCGCYTIWNMIRFLQKQPFTAIPIDCRQKNALWILTQDHGVFLTNTCHLPTFLQ